MIVVEDHRPRTIDVDGLYREVRAFCAKGLTPSIGHVPNSCGRSNPYVQAWYST